MNYLKNLLTKLGSDLVDALINANQKDEAGIYEQRERVDALKKKVEDLLKAGANGKSKRYETSY